MPLEADDWPPTEPAQANLPDSNITSVLKATGYELNFQFVGLLFGGRVGLREPLPRSHGDSRIVRDVAAMADQALRVDRWLVSGWTHTTLQGGLPRRDSLTSYDDGNELRPVPHLLGALAPLKDHPSDRRRDPDEYQ